MTENIAKNKNIKNLLSEWLYDAIVAIKNNIAGREFNIKRIDTRRLWPLFVIVMIVSVTITHEAEYAGTFEIEGLENIGWRYAIAINLAILVGEFFTSWSTTRKFAWSVFIASTVGSGALNIAYIKPWNSTGPDMAFAWIYALLPTILIVLLGFLSSNVAKIAKTQEKKWEREAQAALDPKEYKCFCGEVFSTPIGLANHTKKHIAELRDQPNIKNGVSVLVYLKNTYPNVRYYPEITKLNEWAEKATKQKK